MGPFLNWRGLHVEFPAAGYLCWFYHLTALNDRCHITRGYVGLHHILTAMNDVTLLTSRRVSIIHWRLSLNVYPEWLLDHIIGLTWVLKWIFKVIFIKYAAINYLINSISGSVSFLTSPGLVFGFWMTANEVMGRQNPSIVLRSSKLHFPGG